jgi:hypothetical protein
MQDMTLCFFGSIAGCALQQLLWECGGRHLDVENTYWEMVGVVWLIQPLRRCDWVGFVHLLSQHMLKRGHLL